MPAPIAGIATLAQPPAVGADGGAHLALHEHGALLELLARPLGEAFDLGALEDRIGGVGGGVGHGVGDEAAHVGDPSQCGFE